MKFKRGFILLVVIISLFSLTAVVAGENSTSLDDIALVNEISDTVGDDIDEVGEDSSDDNDEESVDLSVRVETENIGVLNGSIIYDIPCTVIASVNGGIAHNTKVNLAYAVDEYFVYDSCNVTMGTYNPDTKIWDIGDLSSFNDAYLTLLIKLDPHGFAFSGAFILIVDATTDSMDPNMSNNFLISYSNITSATIYVEETENKNEAHHEEFIISNPGNDEVVTRIDEPEDNTDSPHPQDNSQPDETDNPDGGVNPNPDSNNGGISDSNGNLNSNDVSKEINQNVLTKSVNSLTDAIADIFNPDSDFSNGNVKDSLNSVAAIYAYDYTKIPVMIFALFLIILIGAFGYDKVKS